MPAVTVRDTWPDAFVVAEVVLIDAVPLAREKVTFRPGTGFLFVSLIWKTSGDVNA